MTVFRYISKNVLKFTKVFCKPAQLSNTAGSKVAVRSPTSCWEERGLCREQSLLLRRWGQVELDQPVLHVCSALPGDISGGGLEGSELWS